MKLPNTPTDNNFRVLIVEDDASISKLVEVQLKMAGLSPFTATDGLDGWTSFLTHDPHLVLCDISMPGMSGHELTSKIRATSGVPIILMTAAGSDENEMLGFKSGADDYISKPFNPKILLARVVANLRRVYRYDGAAPVAAAPTVTPAAAAVAAVLPQNAMRAKLNTPASTVLPEGWTKCDACDYMGPEQRFQATDLEGRPVFICPNCKNRSVTFSIT